jgi:hypothetical protein
MQISFDTHKCVSLVFQMTKCTVQCPLVSLNRMYTLACENYIDLPLVELCLPYGNNRYVIVLLIQLFTVRST